MKVRLRQVCLVARDLNAVVDELTAVLGTRVCHGSGDLSKYGLPARGPMSEGGRKLLADKGVENVVLPLGTDFIEIVSPIREDSSSNRFLERRKGDGGYMMIFQCADLAAIRERCEKHGVRVVFAADFTYYEDVHLHTRDVRGAIVSFARNRPLNEPAGPWYPAGTQWEQWPRVTPVVEIAGAEMQSEDPESLAQRWSDVIGMPLERVNPALFRIAIDDGELRFCLAEDGRGEGVGGLDLRVRSPQSIVAMAKQRGLAVDGDRILLAGMRVRLIGK